MKNDSPFQSGPDRRLKEALASYFEGPDPVGMLARLEGTLARAAERESGLDVLARWARPRVMAAAMVAGFLLGITLWRSWWRHEEAATPISVAILEAPRTVDVNPVMHAVLEDEP